jgi:tetratricopeptide (TPR) repeat protein
MGFLSRRALKRKLGSALIYSPFIRLLLFNVWFQLAFGAALLLAILAALYVPKIWTASPKGFLPVVKISALDKTQNWALKRSARKYSAAGDFLLASQSWEAAVAQNPADTTALRGFLFNALKLEKADRHMFRSTVSQMNWLMRLSGTNAADVELTAKICEKFKWHDVAVFYLGNVQEPLPDFAEAVYLKSLFHQHRLREFRTRFAKTSGTLRDREIPLYALALRAGANGPDRPGAESELEKAATVGEHAQLATRLLMIVCGEKGNVQGYEQNLQKLALRNEDAVSDHANYWTLLKRAGREAEAANLAQTFTRAPVSSAETVRLADAYFQLEMVESSRELLKKTAPAFAQAPEVWVAYAEVLEHLQDWSGMRAIALQIREEMASRDTLWGYAYLLEGRAELAEKRVSSAERAFKKAVECAYEIPPLGFTVARELTEQKYPAFALELFRTLERPFQNDPAFWEAYFEAAFAAHDAEHVLKASERSYALNPREVSVHNRYAAALLVNRRNAEEAIKLTVQLVANFPNSLAAKINHSFALLLNQRTTEAFEQLQRINPQALSVTEASDYYLALFEVYHNLERWDEAAAAHEKIATQALFPTQRRWLSEKVRQIPARQIARKS